VVNDTLVCLLAAVRENASTRLLGPRQASGTFRRNYRIIDITLSNASIPACARVYV